MDLPSDVEEITHEFLALTDEHVAGLVQNLYLHGSLGFGEYFPGTSDIDFVAILSHRPDSDATRALEAVHAQMSTRQGQPHFDGMHIVADDLTRSPLECPDVPCVLDHTFKPAARCDVNPVTWHELARNGITIRGPELTNLDIWTDTGVLVDYTRENVRTYWQGQAAELAKYSVEAARPGIVSWFVLGVPRLHHVLTTHTITSKSGAGRYALTTFDERWHRLIDEALSIRETGQATGAYDHDEAQRGKDNIEFAQFVVDEALAL